MSEATLIELREKHAIKDVLSRYCRGLDRMDKEMAYSVWHEGGTALYHGMYEGSGHGFIDWVWEAHEGMERHSHQIANSLIEINGNDARSEAYITVVLWTIPDSEGNQTEIIGKGRYLDRWKKIDDVWAITHREYVYDMETMLPLHRGNVGNISRRDTNDPSFRHFNDW